MATQKKEWVHEKLPIDIFRMNLPISMTTKNVFMRIALSMKTSTSYVGELRISGDLKLGRTTVSQSVAELKEAGLLKVSKRKNSNFYTLTQKFIQARSDFLSSQEKGK